MSHRDRTLLSLLILTACLSAGCNTRPTPPRRVWHDDPVKTLQVDPADAEERVAVATAETARRRYAQNLQALQSYYQTIGDITKAEWAGREIKNLQETQTFTWTNLPPVENPPAPPNDADERTLVEMTLTSRRAYHDDVDTLARYYETSGQEFKAWGIHNMQARFHPEETFMYLYNVELPAQDLRPTTIYPKANDLYDRALARYRQAVQARPLVGYEKLREALVLFDRVIREYPSSTRIPQTAYYIGKIYGEFFDEHYLATLWYKRALMFDKSAPLPVRYDLAWQYDEFLDDPPKAIAWYKAAMMYEPWFDSEFRFAEKRLEHLIKNLPAGTPEPQAAPQTPPAEAPRAPLPPAENIPTLRPGPEARKPAPRPQPASPPPAEASPEPPPVTPRPLPGTQPAPIAAAPRLRSERNQSLQGGHHASSARYAR